MLSLVFGAFCVVGFLYQLNQICLIYFNYGTITVVEIEMPSRLVAPDVSLCFRYADVWNGSDANATRNLNSTELDQYVRGLQENVTIADIFENTPLKDDIFAKCLSREYRSYSYEQRDNTSCYAIFDVFQFYLQEFICYRLHWKAMYNLTHNYNKFSSALSHPGMLFKVDLNRKFQAADYCKVWHFTWVRLNEPIVAIQAIVHSPHDFPYRSAPFGPIFRPSPGRSLIHVTYHVLQMTRLPQPYTTQCRDYPSIG